MIPTTMAEWTWSTFCMQEQERTSAETIAMSYQCYYKSNYQHDGKRIPIVGLSNELAITAQNNQGTALRAGIGVLCHEMSHGLGLPDLYYTLSLTPKDEHGYADYNNCGPEDWDLMDGGENIFNGFYLCSMQHGKGTSWVG